MTDLPWSREAELELLGAALIDPSTLDVMAEMLRPGDFYHSLHHKAHEAQQHLWRTKGTLDYPLLMTELERQGVPKEQRHTVMALMQSQTGLASHVREYAEIVRDRATLRRVMATAGDIVIKAQGVPRDVSAFVCEAESSLRTVAERGTAGVLETADRGVQGAMDHYQRALSGDKDALGLPTGFPRIDKALGMLPLGHVIVMGRPGNGKSAFAYQVAAHVAAQAQGVFIWSGEMPSEEVWMRLIGRQARLCIRDLLGGIPLGRDDAQRFSDACNTVRELPILVDCTTGLTALQIIVRAQRAARELKQRGFTMRLAVIDHFNLIEHGMRGNEREGTSMGRSSTAITNWSKEDRVTALNLCQLNRQCEDRADKRPIMRDIRECGKIEEDAKVMLGMYIARKHDPTARQGDAEVVIVKARHGADGAVAFHFDGPTNRFMEQQA